MSKNLEIKKRFKILIPEEWSNRERGKFWEDIAAPLFLQKRWKVVQDIEFNGMQTDIYVKDIDRGQKGLVECKFQKEPIDVPTIHKLIGQANCKKVDFAYLISTSELNPKAKGVVEEYHNDKFELDLIVWSSDELVDVFVGINNIKLPELKQKGIGRVETITLLVTHTKDFFWVAEEIGKNGVPSRALIFSSSDNNFSVDDWTTYFSRYEIWQGLEVVIANKLQINPIEQQPISDIEKVIVSKINHADSFDDYHRPCRPEDFFGRVHPQDKFWEFVHNVRDAKTDLRVVCFTGSTGVGKSSLVLKLADDSRQKQEYKDKFYIYHVDVTSVNPGRANFFVTSVIRKALQEAITTEFIPIHNHEIIIESTEPPFFYSRSIQLAINKLKEAHKVVIIFFDQFEEILTKESLSHLYNFFKIAAYEVDSLKGNVILGFCWRTDISLPATHQAYFAWHELERIRKNIDLNEFPFSKKDSNEVLNKFHEYLIQKGERLQPRMKSWILENSQNLPWLLKKFCGDVYNQHLNQAYLMHKKVITKFDIQQIFERDKKRYVTSSEHNACLMYIAANSPTPKIDVCGKFQHHIINSLLASKMVIETGNNYKIYWDIFREYLIDGKLPTITINYRPRTRISTLIKIFRLLNNNLTKSELANLMKLEESTITNAIEDLQNFFQVELNKKTGQIVVSENIINLNDNGLAENLAEQIESHVVIKEIYEKIKPDQLLWYEEFKQLLQKVYCNEGRLAPGTAKDYTSRMLSWFCFTGLLEMRQGWLIARPIYPRQGKQKGKISECEFNKPRTPISKIHPGQLSLLDMLENT